MRKKIIIINYGCSDLNNLNPNSASIIALISQLSDKYDIHIITDGVSDSKNVYCNDKGNYNIHSFPVIKYKGRSFIDVTSESSFNYLKRNINIYEVEACIAVSYPFYPSIKIMNKFKRMNPNIKRIIYEFDPLAFNGASKFNFIEKFTRIVLESIEFFKVDSIWLTRELYECYNKNGYRIFNDKMVNLGIPLLNPNRIFLNTKNQPVRENNRINLVYTGTFYDDIRSPKYLIEIMYRIVKNYKTDIVLHLYGSILGDECNQILREAKEILKEKLIIHGNINRKDVTKVLLEADILINVSNTVRNQLPSKVFEYIETCKPIISLSKIEHDSSSFYLSRYPLALLINESWEEKIIHEHVTQIVQFCEANINKSANAQDICKLYDEYLVTNIAKCADYYIEGVTHK